MPLSSSLNVAQSINRTNLAQFFTSQVVQDFFHRQFMIWKVQRVSSPTAIMVQKKYSIKACKHKSFTQKISCVQNMFKKNNVYIYMFTVY